MGSKRGEFGNTAKLYVNGNNLKLKSIQRTELVTQLHREQKDVKGASFDRWGHVVP